MVGSFLAALLCLALPMSIRASDWGGLLVAFPALLVGPLYALPVLLLCGLPLCIYADRKNIRHIFYFVLFGALTAGLYSTIILGVRMTLIFTVAGFFTGICYWWVMYKRPAKKQLRP